MRRPPLASRIRSTPILLAAVSWAGTAYCDDEPNATKDRERDTQRALEVVRGAADEYSFRAKDEADSPRFERVEWVNPVKFDQVGIVCLWLREGRPEAIGTIFTSHQVKGELKVNHEFHSLSVAGFVVDHDTEGRRRWRPPAPGVGFEELPGPEPARSRAGRLLQMRALARTFAAHSIDYEKSRWELRLLTKPIARYPERAPGAVDGATFAFLSTAGTDPEVILTIEARETDGGLAWHWSAARFSDQKLFLRRGERVVWSFEKGSTDPFVDATVTDRYRLLTDRVLDAETLQPISGTSGGSR